MTNEAKNEKLKPKHNTKKVCATVTRWTIAALLVIQLILAIALQAYWKLITLLIILIAGLTILPKQYRKWFYLSLTTVVIILTIWVFLPVNNEGWKPYTFNEEIKALNEKYYVPDEQNAAVIYNQLSDIFEDPCIATMINDYNLYELSSEPWTTEQYPEYSAWFNNNQHIIDLILKLNNYEKCYFPLNPAPYLDQDYTNHFFTIKKATLLMGITAKHDIANNNIPASLIKDYTTLKISDHCMQMPSALDKLVGVAIEALALRHLDEKIMDNKLLTNEELNLIKEELCQYQHSYQKHFTELLDYEKLYLKNFLMLLYEANEKKEIRFNPDPGRYSRIKAQEYLKQESEKRISTLDPFYEKIAYQSFLESRLQKATTIANWLVFPKNPLQLSAHVDQYFKDVLRITDPNYQIKQKPQHYMNTINPYNYTMLKFSFRYFLKSKIKREFNHYYPMYNLFKRVAADKKGTLLLIAIKQYHNDHGNWPDSLSVIHNLTEKVNFIDPRNNGSFAYKLTEDGFLLYSTGANKIDENGKSREPADDWPIWPPDGDDVWNKDDPNDEYYDYYESEQ